MNDFKQDLKYYSPIFIRSFYKMRKKLAYYYGPYAEKKQTRVQSQQQIKKIKDNLKTQMRTHSNVFDSYGLDHLMQHCMTNTGKGQGHHHSQSHSANIKKMKTTMPRS